MKDIFTLLLLMMFIFLTSQIMVRDQSSEPEAYPIVSAQNLQFENFTGKGITADHIKSFIYFANYSCFLYRDDIEKNMKYIKYRMDELYGSTNDNFYVIIQTDLTITNRYYWVTIEGVVASLSGINQYFPYWSYLFSKSYGSNKIAEYDFYSKGMKGKGITSDLETRIKNIIQTYETEATCKCTGESIQNIGKNIDQNSAWSVICDDKGVTYALIRTFNQSYISTKVKNCYYTIFKYV